MTYKWCKSQYTANELNGKSVNFIVPLERGGTASGEGKLEAKSNSEGLIAVRILHNYFAPDGALVVEPIFIPVEEMAKLVRNPKGSKCEFAINAA
jgi:hypothetical protein